MIGDVWRLAGLAMLAVLSIGGCTALDTPEIYNRHSLSEITLPREGGDIFYFDVSVTPEFPDSSAAAEAQRMKWLAEWLEQRHLCATGYEILKKRKFEYMEDNPARRDIRYEARCKTG